MILGQLTDSHIKIEGRLAYDLFDSKILFDRAIARVNNHAPEIDAVIVTGDLTDIGLPEEYKRLRECLDKLEMPWFPVPGNHDQRDNFLKCFGDLPALKNCDEFVQYTVEDYPIRLIGLDTVVNEKSYGFLCEKRLEWLDKTLSEQPDRPTMLFMHHPPIKVGITHMDVQNLTNAEALYECIAPHRQVKHLACGHVHRAIETCVNGVGVSIAPNGAHAVALDLEPNGPACFEMDPAAFRLFLIDDDSAQIISHVGYVEDNGGMHPFFDENGKLIT